MEIVKQLKTRPSLPNALTQKRWFSSVGVKLFLVIFVGILVCVLIVGMFSYSKSKRIIEEKMAASSAETIAQVAKHLDLVFSQFEGKTMEFLTDTHLQNDYMLLEKSKDTSIKINAIKEIETKMSELMNNDANLYGAALIPLQDELIGTSAGNSQINYTVAKDSDWVKQAKEANGQVIWLPVQMKGFNEIGEAPTIGLARVIVNAASNTPLFVLLLEVRLETLEDQLSDITLEEGSKLQIITSSGLITYANNKELLGKSTLVAIPGNGENSLQGQLYYETDSKQMLGIYQQFKHNNWKLLGTIPVSSLVQDANQIRNLTIIFSGVAALIAIGIGVLVIRMIVIPLARLRNLMNEGEKGNLTVRSTVKSKDEIGQLSQSFNQMMMQITALVDRTNHSALSVLATAGELSEASKKTAANAKEIASVTEEIAKGAVSLAIESEHGSELTGDIENRMQGVIAANDIMGSSASEVEVASQTGTLHMSALIEKTGITEEMTRSMLMKVDYLKESTHSIHQILDVLSNLTKQTNILSLNASIEAARAGAAGKGFMVIADEIRKLADQSRQSIGVVSQITATIQNGIEETIVVMSSAHPIFKEQITSVKQANQIFHTVKEQMNEFVDHLGTVSDSISQLGHTQNTLSLAMGNVSAVAEEASATSEEVASLSSEQYKISEDLVKLSDELEAVSKDLMAQLSSFRTT
ncbi:methyl-accepting chemotaxis protein [Paenibacillus oryzisoli]|uniref:methyl-accepting chemotaxis protein n=1 Tax=Paenibacillus oryzisoli TaxID=1850517 RepID=UPI003D2C784C